MGFLSWLKTSEKAVDTGLDLVKQSASGIDMLFFTDEEKSLTSAKIMDQVIALHAANSDQNSIRARVRRLLAVLIVCNYLTLINLGATFGCLGKTEIAEYLYRVANDTLGAHVLAVVIFYFGYYGINTVVKSWKK
jgi:hypothetical protein